MASQATLTGAAGEHYVMYELLRRNYIAALAPAGAPNADIIVSDVQGGRLCSIQVKTRTGVVGRHSNGGWHMKAKHATIIEDRLFYCFLDIEREPQVYLIPSAVVAEVIKQSHIAWLQKPAKNGDAHNEHNMRWLLPDYKKSFPDGANPYPSGWLDRYKNAWHSLDLRRVPLALENEGPDGGFVRSSPNDKLQSSSRAF